MSLVTIDLTTKALIRALQWRQIEKEAEAQAVQRDKYLKAEDASE